MEFLKIYLIGVVVAFIVVFAFATSNKMKIYIETGKFPKYDWKEITYLSLHSFGLFSLIIHDFFENRN